MANRVSCRHLTISSRSVALNVFACMPVRLALVAAALACGACATPQIDYPQFATVASPRVLAEFNGVKVYGGGFGSALAADPRERRATSIMLTDRGPNADGNDPDKKVFPMPRSRRRSAASGSRRASSCWSRRSRSKMPREENHRPAQSARRQYRRDRRGPAGKGAGHRSGRARQRRPGRDGGREFWISDEYGRGSSTWTPKAGSSSASVRFPARNPCPGPCPAPAQPRHGIADDHPGRQNAGRAHAEPGRQSRTPPSARLHG